MSIRRIGIAALALMAAAGCSRKLEEGKNAPQRQSSKSPQTCKDTELVVPIEKLDRAAIVKATSRLKPRGETPLIHSSLQAVEDLKAAGGDVTLNIVGFTLKGEQVESELGALAGSTGGRYYSAQDGAQLSRAVKLAALNRLPYHILDAAGNVVASGQTSELSRELPPGKYRIRVDALGQVLDDSLTIVPNQSTTIGLGVEREQFVLRH